MNEVLRHRFIFAYDNNTGQWRPSCRTTRINPQFIIHVAFTENFIKNIESRVTIFKLLFATAFYEQKFLFIRLMEVLYMISTVTDSLDY